MNGQTQHKLLKIVNVLLTIGVFYFAFVYGKTLLENANFNGLRDRWYIVILAFLVFFTSYAISSLHWLRVCRMVDENADKKLSLTFFASQPYKYLPSSIFTFSYRAVYAKKLGLSIKQSSLAQLVENFNLLGSGIFVSFVFYIFSSSILAGIIISLVFCILSYSLTKIDLEIKLPKVKTILEVKKLMPNFCIMIAAWTVSGFAFLLVNTALGISISPAIAISASAAAYVVSILAIFAPGGIGVRELVLSVFSIQQSAIVLWRLLTFVADILFGVIAILLLKKINKAKT